MAPSGGLTSGLAFLPTWLSEAKDTSTLETLFPQWVQASGWRSAGMAWPADGNPKLIMTARDGRTDRPAGLHAEATEVIRTLLGGQETVVWQQPGTAGRLYTLMTPPGRPHGLLWAERGGAEPWGDADRHYLRLSARLIERSPAVGAVLGSVVDTDRLNQRLADAALIAGRMAHDFDNVLTGIIGFADLSGPLLAPGSQPAKFVAEIGKAGHRGIQFTQQLHQLSRSGQTKPQPGSVPLAATKEIDRLRSAGVRVETELPPALAAVAADAGPLQTVLGHLLDNAAEACPAGGTVSVAARAVELNPTEAKGYLGQVGPGGHVEVTVRDTGPGIKPEVRARLFAEPFVTTKVRHRGLGLAVVYRTLFAHRGGIRVETPAPPETGTVVRIVLPLAAARPAVPPAAAARTPTLGG